MLLVFIPMFFSILTNVLLVFFFFTECLVQFITVLVLVFIDAGDFIFLCITTEFFFSFFHFYCVAISNLIKTFIMRSKALP